MRHFRGFIALAGVALLAGCADQAPTSPSDEGASASLASPQDDTSDIQDVRALRVPLPRVVRPWDTSRVAFVQTVQVEDGYVTIGFKEPASGRLQSTGIRAAVSRATILAGHRLLRGAGARIIHPLKHIGAVIVQMDPERAADLRDHPLIDYVEPRRWAQLDGVPGTASSLRSFLAAMPQYTNEILPWGVNMVNAPEAWDSAQAGGYGAKVLIIDTGYERGHPDLPVIWYQNCGGVYGGCDDTNGHGTHVTGILTARDNSIGVVGVAPAISETGLLVWGACRASDGWCDQQDAAYGIDWAIGYVQVINMSFSTAFASQYPIELANAVAAALAADIVVVAAAGNNRDDTPVWPAAQEGVIGVSGVQNNYQFASTSSCPQDLVTQRRPRSNWGQHVDLAAPFWALSTVPGNNYGDESGTPTGSGQGPFWCGTSMAAPHVSGAAAILRGRYPGLSRQQVEAYLFQYAYDRGPQGWDDHYGHGIVDVWNALKHVQSPPPPPPPPPPPSGFSVSMTGPNPVLPYSYCLFSAAPANGAEPYSFAWTADGVPVGDDSPFYRHSALTSAFQLGITVTDGQGRVAVNSLQVGVDPGAPQCNDS